ncbi:membrane protein [Rhodobacteraceae phage LS06-2018-MD07]|jgi:hypothetical protein|nr:membrane protein [Rhodobacteraceae phage LS06-2018-MD07]
MTKKAMVYVIALMAGIILANVYIWQSFIHELNHIVAALLTGNIPVHLSLSVERSFMRYEPVLAAIFPFLHKVVSTAGAGMAFALPGILWLVFKRARWLSLLVAPAALPVIRDFGRGSDFSHIVNPGYWLIFWLFATMAVYCFAIAIYHREVQNVRLHERKGESRRRIQRPLQRGNASA